MGPRCACMYAKSLQSCPTLCDTMDCSPPGSFVQGSFQARILEWVAMPSSRGSSQPRDRTQVSCGSCIADGFFTTEPPRKPLQVVGHQLKTMSGRQAFLPTPSSADVLLDSQMTRIECQLCSVLFAQARANHGTSLSLNFLIHKITDNHTPHRGAVRIQVWVQPSPQRWAVRCPVDSCYHDCTMCYSYQLPQERETGINSFPASLHQKEGVYFQFFKESPHCSP